VGCGGSVAGDHDICILASGDPGCTDSIAAHSCTQLVHKPRTTHGCCQHGPTLPAKEQSHTTGCRPSKPGVWGRVVNWTRWSGLPHSGRRKGRGQARHRRFRTYHGGGVFEGGGEGGLPRPHPKAWRDGAPWEVFRR